MKNIIAYYRVSTREQGNSGLGLDAQRLAISKLGHTVVAEYTDIASGRKDDRPQLAMALEHARKIGAALTVAKLDRLSRRVSFTAKLLEGQIAILVADQPEANVMLLHMLAVFAESEAKAISERTKAALAIAKKRGVLLGSARPGHWEGREHLRGGANNVKPPAKGLLSQVAKLRSLGLTMDEIAAQLKDQGLKTPKGCTVTRTHVYRWLKVVNASSELAVGA
jgi:DNA invertase Pin-like site-specific DNA recombinase